MTKFGFCLENYCLEVQLLVPNPPHPQVVVCPNVEAGPCKIRGVESLFWGSFRWPNLDALRNKATVRMIYFNPNELMFGFGGATMGRKVSRERL